MKRLPPVSIAPVPQDKPPVLIVIFLIAVALLAPASCVLGMVT